MSRNNERKSGRQENEKDDTGCFSFDPDRRFGGPGRFGH
jgi:hypothetical protein